MGCPRGCLKQFTKYSVEQIIFLMVAIVPSDPDNTLHPSAALLLTRDCFSPSGAGCPAAECACVCVRARGVAMATTLRRCVCTGTCHARAGKPVRFHNSSICWQGVVADVGNIFLAVGMMQQFSYGLHVWR